jgi:putative transport protein
MEIFKENGAIANLFTKFAISMAQFLLPFLITFVAARDMSFRTLYFLAAGIIIVDGIFLAILPFPPKEEAPKAADGTVEKRKMKLTPSAILLVCIGFTASTTFMLFMNCNQELGKLYGMANPSMIQSFYSAGIICAVLLTAALMKKGLKPIRVLVIYPCVAFCALLLMYFVQIPQICMIGGFLIGYFAAGGVLQLATSTANEMFPRDKGKITAVVMIASSIANYAVLNVASLLSKVGGVEGPRYILLFNAVVTAIGIVFAIILNLRFEKDAQ